MKWSEAEKELVRRLYPTTTAEALSLLLPRSATSIRAMVNVLKVEKKVHAPKNWRPIGSERIDRGIPIRKVTDTRNPKKDWKRIDVIEWEAAHGPIPPGYFLMLKDSSKPRTLDNLALFTGREHLDRIAFHNKYPPELRNVIRLTAKLQRAIRRQEGTPT
ncbi:MAG: hypothetical protein I8H71_00755 [Xanthomonadaceae bacterium]|nr:hypothetical protein [Xanthomonadaceae bacterium]